MKVEILRETKPTPITGAAISLDANQLCALLDVCDWHRSVAFTREITPYFSPSRKALDAALLSIWKGLPLEAKAELRRQS